MRLTSQTVSDLRQMFGGRLLFEETGPPTIEQVVDGLCPDTCDPGRFKAQIEPELAPLPAAEYLSVVSFRSGFDTFQVRIVSDGRGVAISCAVTTPNNSSRAARTRLEALSDRERQVLSLLIDGLSNKQVAAALYLSPRTVEKHRASIYRKTGSHSLALLTKIWMDSGLADSPGGGGMRPALNEPGATPASDSVESP